MHNLSVNDLSKVRTPREVFAESPRSYLPTALVLFSQSSDWFQLTDAYNQGHIKTRDRDSFRSVFISEAMAEVAQISLLLLSSSLLIVASDPRGKTNFQV